MVAGQLDMIPSRRLVREPPFDKFAASVVILGATALAVWLSWTGFIGSDDALYASSALRWLHDGPIVGTTHFSIRLTTILPIAMSFKLLGVREFSLILPTLISGLVVVAIESSLAFRMVSARYALFAVLPFVTTPLLSSSISTPGVDLTELMFDLGSLGLFVTALRAHHRAALLYFAGFLAGMGWMSRETSVFLALFYGLLFLAGYRIGRREYFLIGAGFLTVALGEMCAYYLLTGDPLYRLGISLHHDLVDRDAVHSLFDYEGNVHISGPIGMFLNPLLMIFLNKVFGVIFWLCIPAAVWLIRARSLAPDIRDSLVAIAIAGLVWVLGVFLMVNKLYLVPRYMLFPMSSGTLLIGAWLAFEILPRYGWRSIAILGAVVIVNFLAIDLEDHDLMYPERALVSYVRSMHSTVYTDRETFRRAFFLLECEGLTSRVSDQQHRLGDIFFYVPDNVSFKPPAGHEFPGAISHATYNPLPGETLIAKFVRPERWIGRLLDTVGVSGALPPSLMAKVRGNQRGAFIYQEKSASL